MSTYAVLPVKRFELAKQRLSPAVAAPLRSRLTEAMVGDVLEALAGTPALDGVLVVTAEGEAAALARAAGAEVVDDALEEGQSAAAHQGIERAVELGADRALLVPGDCPALDPAEVAELIEEGEAGGEPERGVTIVPDRHGTGTNALLLRPPGVLAPSFGEDSFERHRSAAAALGLDVRVARPASLLLDVDTGRDLAELERRLEQRPGLARRTRAVLHDL